MHGHLGGLPPRVDLAAERALAALLADASSDAVVTSAHDLSDGGLAQALAEASFRNGVGVSVSVADVAGGDAFVALFSESAARAIVTVTTDNADRLVALAERHGVPVTPLGQTGATRSRSRDSSRSRRRAARGLERRPCRPPSPEDAPTRAAGHRSGNETGRRRGDAGLVRRRRERGRPLSPTAPVWSPTPAGA